MRSFSLISLIASLTLSAAACVVGPAPSGEMNDAPGDDDGRGPGPGDDSDPGDDPGGPDDDAPGDDDDDDETPRDCTVPASLSVGTIEGGIAELRRADPADPDSARYLSLLVRLTYQGDDPDAPTADYLRVEIWEGHSGDAGFRPGRFSIAGADTDFTACSNCVTFFGDVVLATGSPTQIFMADGGTLDIAAIDPSPTTGVLEGSLQNVTFREVTVGEDGQSEVLGGCESEVTDFRFLVDVVEPS